MRHGGFIMISIEHLTKRYRSGKGIFDIHFQVNEGEVFGFLGPNGAGKTTTIRQLLGFTNADEGTCTIKGIDTRLHAEHVHRDLGYLPGEIAFFDHMTGSQFLSFMAELYLVKDFTRMTQLLQRFELEANVPIRKMSKGMKQKVALVVAFMHDPKVYILDEPTSGLDPLMQQRFIELVLEEKARGKTILMSSHLFDEVERTCERVAIIKEGRIVTIDKIADLRQQMMKSYQLTVSSAEDLTTLQHENIPFIEVSPLHLEVTLPSHELPRFFHLFGQLHISDVTMKQQTLEEIFIHYYKKEGDN